MASYSRTMDFLHQKLLQARTKDQEDKIVDWMFAEAKLKQAKDKKILNDTLYIQKSLSRQKIKKF